MSYALTLIPPLGQFDNTAVASVFTMKTSPNGGLWSINDRTAVYDSVSGNVYIGYASSVGAVQVLTWNPVTATAVSTVTLATGLELHAAPAMLIRDDGYVLVGWSAHDGTVIKLATSTAANSAAAFTTDTITAAEVDGWADITYIYLHQMASGRIFMFWREVHATAGIGDGRVAYSYSDDGGVTWTLRSLVLVAAAPTGNVIYWKSISDGTKIHLFHTDTDRSDANPSSLYHRYYDAADGLWHKSDGTSVSSTDPTTSTLIHDDSSGPISPTGTGLDANGPFISYNIYKSGTTSSDLYVARYRSGAWQNNMVVNNGGLANGHRTLAHIAVNAGNPDRALCSVKSGSNHEAFLYTSGDDGATWAAEQLTSASGSNALGPQGVLDAPAGLEFLWARGSWTTDSSYSVGLEGFGFA